MLTKKSFSKLKSLDLGQIKAKGFLKAQLERNKNGMGGHLDELEPEVIAHPYITKVTSESLGSVKSGWSAEISGNYWYGLIGLAFTLNDPDLIKKADEWVEKLIETQEPDGYLGVYTKKDNLLEDYNAWGTSFAMRALLQYYEATHKNHVFNAVYKCMLWFCDTWAEKKSGYAGLAIIEPMIYCYHKTQDERLLKFAVDYEEFLCKNDLYSNSVNAFLDKKLKYNSNHTCAYGIAVRQPALIYSANGDKKYLKASTNGIKKVLDKAVQKTGGPVCNAEYLSPISATGESEYCSFTFFNASYALVGQVTGNAVYGDYMEKVVYNAAQGARKKDEKAIVYMSSPNQLYATGESSNSYLQHQLFAPCHPVACCAVSSVSILPDFIKNMAYTDDRDSLYINIYGPCEISHKNTLITQETLYPFRDTVTLNIDTQKEESFAIYLKIPYWCNNFEVLINGKSTNGEKDKNNFFKIEKAWNKNDEIIIKFNTQPTISRVNDADAGKKHPLCVEYGALTFALPVSEIWNNLGNGYARTPLPEGWSWYSVSAGFTDKTVNDAYELMGHRKYQTSWNVAIDEHNALKSIEVHEEDIGDEYVWEKIPLKITMDAYKALYAYPPYPIKTYEIYEEKLDVSEKLKITLVPYGCTNLRITYLPRANI